MKCTMILIRVQRSDERNLPHLIAACIARHQRTCTVHYISKGFFFFFSPKSTCLLLCWSAIACGPDMAATLRAFRPEYYLWRFDWLKLLEWLAARNSVSSSEFIKLLLSSLWEISVRLEFIWLPLSSSWGNSVSLEFIKLLLSSLLGISPFWGDGVEEG